MSKRSINAHKFIDKKGTITKEDFSMVYGLIEKAVDRTNLEGKTTDEIFGEIYTKFRTEVAVWERYRSLKKFFVCRLKDLNCTEAGKQLSEIINELCQEKIKRNAAIESLELCTIIMHDCLSDANVISDESAKVMSTLEKIGNDLNGESYV
jgi:hypothetical protein